MKKIKTLRYLLTHDGIKASELAKLIKINGSLHRSDWGEWQATVLENDETPKIIEPALNELSNFAKAEIDHDSQTLEKFYDHDTPNPLDYFGYNIGKNDELLVEKTAVQNQEELIEQLQSKLTSAKSEANNLREQLSEISTWTGFDDVEDDLIPIELDIALQIYSSAIKNYNPKTGKMDNDQTTKKWLRHKATEFFEEEQGNAVYERIATVANWKKDAGRPPKAK